MTSLKVILKDRQNVNVTIAASLLIHLLLLLLSAHYTANTALLQAMIASGLLLYFVAGPLLWLWHRTTLPGRPDEGLTDIRESIWTELPPYNPQTYFDVNRAIFMGLDEDRRPVYVDWKTFNSTHMQVLGTTGAGKGVQTTTLLIQCALAGQCVIVMDPKDDEFAPNVMARAAREAGIPFILVDLRPDAPPQLNPFRNTTFPEMKELIMTGFAMQDTGTTADFYRLFDRKAARDVIRKAGSNPTMRTLLAATESSPFVTEERGVKFKENLEEMCEASAIDTPGGHDLGDLLSQNVFLYIIGSIRSVETMITQKMILLRILQLIEKRDRTDPQLRKVALMLDEFKYLLSPPSIQALGTVRDKGCHLMLAHQSLGDLNECPGINPAVVKGAVIENTGIKFIYKAKSTEVAKWASELSGSIIVKRESSHMQQQMFGPAQGQYSEVERALLTTNHIYSLAKLQGMLFGVGTATRCLAAHMPSGPRPTITPAARLTLLPQVPLQSPSPSEAEVEHALSLTKSSTEDDDGKTMEQLI